MNASNKQSGFTLVEITITVGLLGFLSYLTMTLLKNQQGQEAMLKYKYEINMKMLEFRKALAVPSRCELLLKGLSVSATGTDVSSDGIGPASQPIIKVQNYPGYDVKQIRLFDGALAGSIDVEVTFAPQENGFLEKMFRGNGSRSVERFSLVATKDSANKVKSCGPLVSETNNEAKRIACLALNNGMPAPHILTTWNYGTSTCQLQGFRCSGNQVPRSLNSLGIWRCENMATRANYNHIFDTAPAVCTSKTYYLYTTSAGKIAIGCNGMPLADRTNSTRPKLQ